MEYRECYRTDCAFDRGARARERYFNRNKKEAEVNKEIEKKICTQYQAVWTKEEIRALLKECFIKECQRRGWPVPDDTNMIKVEYDYSNFGALVYMITKEDAK